MNKTVDNKRKGKQMKTKTELKIWVLIVTVAAIAFVLSACNEIKTSELAQPRSVILDTAGYDACLDACDAQCDALFDVEIVDTATAIEIDTASDTDTNESFFTVIVLPDMGVYVKSWAQSKFTMMMDWIVANKDDLNIKFVTQVGDIVDDSSNTTGWQWAQSRMQILGNAGIDYAVAYGNHDMSSGRNTVSFNTYFPLSTFSAMPSYGGAYEANKSDNTYFVFEDYLLLSLEFGPRDGVLAWANTVANSYPNRKIILTTHGYLDAVGQRLLDNDYKSPCSGYNLGVDCNAGESIYQSVLANRANDRFVFCGHITAADGDGAEHLLTGDLSQQMVNYAYKNPYKGAMRIVKIYSDRAEMSTYAVYNDAWPDDDDNAFTINF